MLEPILINARSILVGKRSQSRNTAYLRFQQYDILEKEKIWRQ